MLLKINKEFTVEASRDLVWAMITDVNRVVTCLPGASIEEQLSENEYNGKMSIKVGPLNMNFGGKAEITEVNEPEGIYCLSGKGSDKGGKGMANMHMKIVLSGDSEKTSVKVDADLDIAGKLAQFGSRIIDAAANSIFNKFVDNFNKLATDPYAKIEAGKPLSAVSMAKDTLGQMFKRK